MSGGRELHLVLEREAELIEKARSDSKAFHALYEHYLPSIYRYVHYRLRSRQETEDIVSQTFLQALEYLENYKQKGIPFGHWLYRIAGNLIYRHYKKASRENIPLSDSLPVDPDVSTEQFELLMLLHTLPDAQQQVLTLRYIQDLSIKDVAGIMNRSEGAVKQLSLRALHNLRERVNDIA